MRVRPEPGTHGQDGLWLVAAALAVAAVALLYVRAERWIYFWDAALYQTIVADTGAAFARSWSDGVAGVGRSLSDDYNQLFALPLVPIAGAAAQSRAVYVTALALVYHLPMALVLGALAAAVLRDGSRRVAWGAVVLVLCLPTVWAPTLRGLPDASAAALYYIGLLAYARHSDGGSRRHAVLAGAAVAGAALFRRHFAYAALVVYAAALIHAPLLAGASTGRPWPQRARHAALTLALMALGSALVLGTIGVPFMQHTFAADYYTLYRSYLQPPAGEFRDFITFYGVLPWTLSAAGWIAAARRGLLRPGPASFVALTGSGAFALWVFYVRQWGPQYGFHVTPLLVAGLAALGVTVQRGLARHRSLRTAAVVTAALLLAVNAWHSFGVTSPVRVPRIRRLLAARYPPATRPDYDEVLRLTRYLRTVAPADAPIFVVGSSETFNWDVLARADALVRDPAAPPLAIGVAPQVDSRDWVPVEDLLEAQVAVVASPFQHHLEPDEQDVVRVAGLVFSDGWELARDFARSPEQFHLRDGVTVQVYVRERPTPAAAALRFASEMDRALAGDALGVRRRPAQ